MNFFDSDPRGGPRSIMSGGKGRHQVVLHMPPGRRGEAEEVEHDTLPTHAARHAFRVDHFTRAQELFPGSDALVTRYFVPVVVGRSMWLDMNLNKRAGLPHSAALLDIQGINPVTGHPMSFDAASRPRLQQYRTRCPVHARLFVRERFCDSCGYKWPPQNYFTSMVTPHPSLWWNGTRTEEGVVRQWFFAEDEARSIAAVNLGAARHWSLRVTWYHDSRPRPRPSMSRGTSRPQKGPAQPTPGHLGGGGPKGRGSFRRVEIGAGAMIDQGIVADPHSLEHYEWDPAEGVEIFYVTEDQAQRIIGEEVGGLPVGNPPPSGAPHQSF